MNMNLLCPLCGAVLHREENRYICPNRHSFDIARQGYVNLLTVQQKHSLHPGDTREQVLSRRAFLEAGFYTPIVEALIAAARELDCHGPILDVGCGEGYYSSRLKKALDAPLLGLDISKDAVRCASASYKDATWVCATAARLPVEDGSIGLLTSLFALTLPEEFHRVLNKNGYFFQVLAAQDHLMGLKNIIYPEIKLRDKDSVPELPGFQLVKSLPIRFSFTVRGAQVQQLLGMTPHTFRISKAGAEALAATETLTDTASCVLNIYRPV
jgi:23S rRNA (guanine745-N1)-methyltransferase